MITFLRVRNLAIVEEFEIEPGNGLNVLTGETGAGKSLLIDSLEFLSGARGSAESVRTGADKMTAEAIFHLPQSHAKAFEERGIDVEPVNGTLELVVRREFSAAGRGRASVNGALLAVRELEDAMDPILEIHGQDESHDRIAGQGFRELLDAYGELEPLVAETSAAHEAWSRAAAELGALKQAEKDRGARIDLLRYQIEEISAAKLVAGEEEQLREERAMLANSQQLAAAMSESFSRLDDDEDSAVARVAHAAQQLEPLGRGLDDVRRIAADLEDIRVRLQETARDIGRFAVSIRHDPARLDEVEERLAAIDRLKRKYGASVADVVAHLETIEKEFDQLSDFEASAAKLERVESERFRDYRRLAAGLSSRRAAAAAAFEKEIQAELRDLAMERTTVRIVLDAHNLSGSRLDLDGRNVAFGPEGFDTVGIMIAPNRGEELRPMSKIASGGELSRIQLAIAAALFKHARTTAATLVFDEVDQGIGGRVAEVVGRKLQELSGSNQVICVTHLPQIASMAATQFRVWKEDAGGRTRARIEKLSTREERIEELARMLGGATVTESARMHAAELLGAGEATASKRKNPSRKAP